jgi:predicted RNA-binding Zn ribbon-like protein
MMRGGMSVPDNLWLVESFLNSVDIESGQDDLDSLARFRRWLRDHHRAAAAASATGADLAFARRLREGLRAAARLHAHPHPAAPPAELDDLAGQIPLRAWFTPIGVELGPAAGGVPRMLGEVLAAVTLAGHDGTWRRLKLCRDDACQVVFFDRSKNGSRCWCSMEVCGNRNKTRSYRRRHHASGLATEPAGE